MCRFPPLRIRFERDAAAGSAFEGQRSLKLVTHCERGATHAQYVVQELLAYRIYNRITRHSFRVRPLAITYLGQGGRGGPGSHFAFVIEDLREVARRTDHRRARRMPMAPEEYDAPAMARFMLFQYLIGNTDWEVLGRAGLEQCCHNVRVIAPRDGTGLVALPYDFDVAGIIDAAYAAPHPSLPIDSVTERLYRGFCAHDGPLEQVRGEFLAARQEILDAVRTEPRLGSARRNATLRYLAGSYETFEDPDRFARDIRGCCRKPGRAARRPPPVPEGCSTAASAASGRPAASRSRRCTSARFPGSSAMTSSR